MFSFGTQCRMRIFLELCVRVITRDGRCLPPPFFKVPSSEPVSGRADPLPGHTQGSDPAGGEVKPLLRVGNFSTGVISSRSTGLKQLLNIKHVAKREQVMVHLKDPSH